MSRTETEFAFGADGYTPHPTFQGVPPPPHGPGISKHVSTCGASTREGRGGGRGTAYTEWYIQGWGLNELKHRKK